MATEIIREDYEVEPPHHRIVGVLARVIDLAFGLLEALLLIRFALVFFAARQGAGFYQLIHDATQPFYRPFEGLFSTSTFAGFQLEWPLLVALVAYVLLHAAIRGVISFASRA
jgi:uncharacterized protein YggT (Ycf19 family)